MVPRLRSLARLAFGSVLVASQLAAQRPSDTQLNTPGGVGSATQVDLAAEGDRIYAVWAESRDGLADVFFNRSLDGGESWLASDLRLDTDPAGASTSQVPRIALSGDALYVVWRDARDGNRDLYFNRSLDGGDTWLANDIRIDSTAPGLAFAGAPTLAAQGSEVYVAWEDNRFGDVDVFFDRSMDGGLTWQSQDTRLDPGTPPGAFRSNNVRMSRSGSTLYVIWEDWQLTGLGDTFFNRSLDGGLTWLPAERRLEQNQPALKKSILADVASSEDGVFCVWGDFRNASTPDIYFNRSLDGGSTWLSRDVRLDTGDAPGASASQYPRVAVQGDAVYVVWEDNRDGGWKVFFNRSLDQGLTWLATDLQLSSDDVRARTPLVSANGDVAFVLWEQADAITGVGDIVGDLSVDQGNTWLAEDIRLDQGVPPGTSESADPALAVTSGAAYVAWRDARNGGWDAYFNLPFGSLGHGLGSPGTGGLVPGLSSSGTPLLGLTLEVSVENGRGGAIAFLLLGQGGRSSGTLFGAPLLVGGPLRRFTLFLDGAPGAAGAGHATVSLTIPPLAALMGTSANLQAAVVDPQAATGFLATTGGLELWIH